jgi:hypothetical protein
MLPDYDEGDDGTDGGSDGAAGIAGSGIGGGEVQVGAARVVPQDAGLASVAGGWAQAMDLPSSAAVAGAGAGPGPVPQGVAQAESARGILVDLALADAETDEPVSPFVIAGSLHRRGSRLSISRYLL